MSATLRLQRVSRDHFLMTSIAFREWRFSPSLPRLSSKRPRNEGCSAHIAVRDPGRRPNLALMMTKAILKQWAIFSPVATICKPCVTSCTLTFNAGDAGRLHLWCRLNCLIRPMMRTRPLRLRTGPLRQVLACPMVGRCVRLVTSRPSHRPTINIYNTPARKGRARHGLGDHPDGRRTRARTGTGTRDAGILFCDSSVRLSALALSRKPAKPRVAPLRPETRSDTWNASTHCE